MSLAWPSAWTTEFSTIVAPLELKWTDGGSWKKGDTVSNETMKTGSGVCTRILS